MEEQLTKEQEIKRQVKNYLQTQAIALTDKCDILKSEGADHDLVDMVERAGNICNISILNFDSLDEKELESISQVISLCGDMLKSKENIGKLSPTLNEVLARIETLFRSKKLLLDEKSQAPHIG